MHSDVAVPRSTLSARTALHGPAGPPSLVPYPHFIRHRETAGRGTTTVATPFGTTLLTSYSARFQEH